VYLGDQERHAQHLLTKSSHAPSAALPFQHIEYSSHTSLHKYNALMYACISLVEEYGRFQFISGCFMFACLKENVLFYML